MPRDGAIIFSDLTGKLEVLRVSCDKCGRDGCYGLHRLIEKRGRVHAAKESPIRWQGCGVRMDREAHMKFFLPVQDPKIAEESYQGGRYRTRAITRSITATVAKTYALRSEDPIR
jgi:hypothetical protein